MNATLKTIREIAAQIITGHLAPLDGAQLIAAEAARLEDPGNLECFAAFATDGNEEAVLEQASLLLADTA